MTVNSTFYGFLHRIFYSVLSNINISITNINLVSYGSIESYGINIESITLDTEENEMLLKDLKISDFTL